MATASSTSLGHGIRSILLIVDQAHVPHKPPHKPPRDGKARGYPATPRIAAEMALPPQQIAERMLSAADSGIGLGPSQALSASDREDIALSNSEASLRLLMHQRAMLTGGEDVLRSSRSPYRDHP